MARGNSILVSGDARRTEGIIATGETPKPGTVLQIDPTVALVGGRHTWKIFDRGADGDRPVGPLAILDADWEQGKLATDAYAAGDRCWLFFPRAGDEFNCLLLDISGTGDDNSAGELLMVDDGTGKLIATTGTPESEPFVLLETVTDPTADTLAWTMYSGY